MNESSHYKCGTEQHKSLHLTKHRVQNWDKHRLGDDTNSVNQQPGFCETSGLGEHRSWFIHKHTKQMGEHFTDLFILEYFN